MAISETTRRCSCGELVDAPAAAECPRCRRRLVPHHSTWPLWFKWWLISEKARRSFLPWLAQQEVWVRLMRDAMVFSGALNAPNPRGTQYSDTTPDAELFEPALEIARGWKASNSPIAHATDLVRQTA